MVVEQGGRIVGVTPVDVLRTVAVLCGRSRADMVGGSHRRDISEDRHVAMYVARIVTEAPYTELAGVFRRSESTVRYGVRTVRRRMRHSSLLAEKVRVVEEQVRKGQG